MPDYLVLFSTLGGLSLVGITGFVLGPVIAALFMAVWQMYEQDQSTDAAGPDRMIDLHGEREPVSEGECLDQQDLTIVGRHL